MRGFYALWACGRALPCGHRGPAAQGSSWWRSFSREREVCQKPLLLKRRPSWTRRAQSDFKNWDGWNSICWKSRVGHDHFHIKRRRRYEEFPPCKVVSRSLKSTCLWLYSVSVCLVWPVCVYLHRCMHVTAPKETYLSPHSPNKWSNTHCCYSRWYQCVILLLFKLYFLCLH